MINKETEFYLPFGFKDTKGVLHRKGTMRDVTAEDELMLVETNGVRFNDRQRDLELLARLITSLGTLSDVSAEILEDLYEPDFIYLQMLFNSLNEGGTVTYSCPRCGAKRSLNITDLFKEEKENIKQKEELRFRLPQGSGLTPEIGTKVQGIMVMAKCRDFITLYRDVRTRENPSWFYVGLLTRCIKKLGIEKAINNSVITKLSPQDFSFLVDLFNELNNGVIRQVIDTCSCGTENHVEMHLPGEA
jgi:phage FluMu protein gp41